MTGARASWIALAIAVSIAVGAVIANPVHSWRPRADEGWYLFYARRVAADGPSAFPDLFREYLEDPLASRLFPSPIRVTTIVAGALAVRLEGAQPEALAHVSLAAFVGLLVLVFLGTRAAFGARAAAATTLLLSVSPLHLGMARRALSDSLNATLALAALGLCLHALGGATRRRWWLASMAFAVAFLGRELNLVLVPIALVLVGARAARRGEWPAPAAVAHVSVIPLALAAIVASLAAGGVAPAWRAFAGTIGQPATNAYALAYGGGPWFRYLLDALLLSPWPPLLFIVWLGYLAGSAVDDERAWAWALVPVLFVACAAPFPKFVRWALAIDAPLRLGAVLLLERLLQRTGARQSAALLAVAVGLLMMVDVGGFRRLFVAGDIYDPTTAILAAARDVVPH